MGYSIDFLTGRRMNLSSQIECLPSKKDRGARVFALLIIILVPLGFGFFAIALGQPADVDLRNYHWYNAYAFLNHRADMDFLPSQNAYFYNPLLDVPFYLIATHVGAKTACYLLGLVQGLNFVLLFMLAYAALQIKSGQRKILLCAALALLGMLGGVGIGEIGTTSNDNLASLGILLSALLVTRFIGDSFPGNRVFGRMLLCGVPAGVAMGLKLTVVTFCIGLCLALLSVKERPMRRFLTSFAFGCGVLLGLACSYGYWGWFLDRHFGSPFFPFFNAVFKSPFAPLAGGRDMTFIPHGLRDYLLFPFLFAKDPLRVNEIWWRDWRIPVLYGMLPLCVVAGFIIKKKKRAADALVRPEATRFLLWMGAISYLFWLALFSIYRYLLPLEMLVPLLILCAADLLPFKARYSVCVAGAALLVVALSIHHEWTERRASWAQTFAAATLPPLGNTSDLMILMAGTDAYAHLVTQFPPEIPFVRVQGYFISQPTEALAARLDARINAHQGRFMILIPPPQHDEAQQALNRYQLAFGSEACAPVIDHLHNDKVLDLCPLVRMAAH